MTGPRRLARRNEDLAPGGAVKARAETLPDPPDHRRRVEAVD